MFHFHLNHFGNKLPKVLVQFQSQGFNVTKCKIKEQGVYNPLWIVTHKDEFEHGVETLFAQLLVQLRADKDMYGYMECEYVTSESVTKFMQADYESVSSFPLRDVPFEAVHRAADIHIFRAKDTPCDELDNLLEQVGFYEVLTPDERIWTLLLGSAQDAEIIYKDLITYFTTAGGISKIEKEVVRLIASAPETFPMRMVARAGFYPTNAPIQR